MKSQRPYLIRALYDWIVDSDEVPHLIVDAEAASVVVPQDYVENGQIILNIGPNAVRDLQLGDDFVMFSSRFDGVSMELVIPVSSIRAIYARDNGAGMTFMEHPVNQGEPPPDPEPPEPSPPPRGKPGLRVVS